MNTQVYIWREQIFLKITRLGKCFLSSLKWTFCALCCIQRCKLCKGSFGEGTVAWPFVFISSPLKDPSKICIRSREWVLNTCLEDRQQWIRQCLRTDSPLINCRVKKEPRMLQPEGLVFSLEFQRSVSSLALYTCRGLEPPESELRVTQGWKQGPVWGLKAEWWDSQKAFNQVSSWLNPPEDWIILLNNSMDPDKRSKHQHLQNWKRSLGKADLPNSNCIWIPTNWWPLSSHRFQQVSSPLSVKNKQIAKDHQTPEENSSKSDEDPNKQTKK